MSKVVIIYDTVSGHTGKMAQAVAEGVARIPGVEVTVKYVDEATGQDLLEAEGVIVGSPTHCGLMSWKLKRFFDQNTGKAWGKVGKRIGAAFSTSGGFGGGNELTLMSILNVLMNYGYLVFGLPDYAASGVTAHYGSVAVGNPDKDDLESCKILGERMASYVKEIWG